MKKQVKRILAIVASLSLLIGLNVGIGLTSHAEAGTENTPNEWEPHNYVADVKISLLMRATLLSW